MEKPADCIFYQLATASRSGARFWSSKIAGYKVTAVQGMVLNFLHNNDHVTSSELGKKTMLDSATLTGILDRLEATGLLERKQHPDDRRAILVCLTEDGLKMTHKLYPLLKEANREFLQGLSAEEQATLRRLLTNIRT